MIEVGEYVRSRIGSIGKVTKIEDNKFLYEDKTLITWTGNVVNHSRNIIDLIEVGDFVNGYGVIDFYLDYFNGNDRREKPKRIAVIVDKFCDNHIKEDEIKTILTHEQYQANCYTVKSSTIN